MASTSGRRSPRPSSAAVRAARRYRLIMAEERWPVRSCTQASERPLARAMVMKVAVSVRQTPCSRRVSSPRRLPGRWASDRNPQSQQPQVAPRLPERRRPGVVEADGAAGGALLEELGAGDAGGLAAKLNIRMLWLPTRCPELNPMDHLWRAPKQEMSANRQDPSISVASSRTICDSWRAATWLHLCERTWVPQERHPLHQP